MRALGALNEVEIVLDFWANLSLLSSLDVRVDGIEILIPEPEVGIDYKWVAGFGFLEVGFDRNSEFGF